MLEKNIRINAMIAYCFLGPLFLFTKQGTPLSHEFVQGHAKKATIHMIIGFLVFLCLFAVRKMLYTSILGFSVYNITIGTFVGIFLLIQAFSAYKAYRGIDGKNTGILSEEIHTEQKTLISEEQKIQIIVSFLPFFGTFIAVKNPSPEVLTGRKIANTFVFLLIIASILQGESFTLLHLIITIAYIVTIASTAVLLMAKDTFLQLPVYKHLPTYHEFEAKIVAGSRMIKEFLYIAFGKEKSTNYQQEYTKTLEKYSSQISPKNPFWTHPLIIGIPFLNLLTIPSLFADKYQEYHQNIIEGVSTTLLLFILLFAGYSYAWIYLLAFSFATLCAESKNNINIRAPISSIFASGYHTFAKIYSKFRSLQKSNQETTHSITESQESKNPQL